MKKVVNAYFKKTGKGEYAAIPSAYLRRYAEEIKPKFLSELLAPQYPLIEKLSKGKYNCCVYRNNQFLPAFVEEGQVVYKSDKPILYTAALNTWNTAKGQDRGEIEYIIFDEFATRELYLKDEFVTFTQVLSSLIREREINCIYMLANTVNKFCPYFEEMGLKEIDEQEQGTIVVYSYNNKKLTVAVEYCADTENTKDIEHYYAFDNPQLDMITSGSWEEARYKRISRLEFVANENTLLLKFLVDFNHKKVVGEIHRDGSNVVLLFHKLGGSKYNWTERDIIFTDQDTYSPLHQNSFLVGDTKAHQVIRKLLSEKKDYYDTNATGEVINNFIKFGRLI